MRGPGRALGGAVSRSRSSLGVTGAGGTEEPPARAVTLS